MSESELPMGIQDALNREIDCRYIEEIQTPGDDEIRCGLQYLGGYDLQGWAIIVLVNHYYQVSSYSDGRLEMLYAPKTEGTEKVSVVWYTPFELTERQARQFNIPDDIRELLNRGLALFREYDLDPNTREIDRDYINEMYHLEERRERLEKCLDGQTPSTDEFTEEEIAEELKEVNGIERYYEEMRGKEVVGARPLEYFLGGLEHLIEYAEEGQIPEERVR